VRLGLQALGIEARTVGGFDLHVSFAKALDNSGEHGRALRHMNAALKLEPDVYPDTCTLRHTSRGEMLLLRAGMLIRSGGTSEARVDLEEAE
jgi:hypothetical protein